MAEDKDMRQKPEQSGQAGDEARHMAEPQPQNYQPVADENSRLEEPQQADQHSVKDQREVCSQAESENRPAGQEKEDSSREAEKEDAGKGKPLLKDNEDSKSAPGEEKNTSEPLATEEKSAGNGKDDGGDKNGGADKRGKAEKSSNSPMQMLKNIYRLGIKELWSLVRDPILLVLIVFTFTVSVYTSSTAVPDSLNLAQLAVVDEDRSPLSNRIISAFYPPMFVEPRIITIQEMDAGMDKGQFTFVLDIPPDFQSDVLGGRVPEIQLNVDATRMSQAFTGGGYIQQMVNDEINEFVNRYREPSTLPVELELRMRFNPNLTQAWFGSLMEVINNITLISIILTGAALIREREHGTIEHLLVMPVTPFEIMSAKVWSMGLVVLIASSLSLQFIVRGALNVPVEGSVALFVLGAALYLFASTSLGIFLATVAKSMPQFGMLLILVILPLQMLSGGSTPRESMPEAVQNIMLAAPTTHFVSLAQAVLFRAAGIEAVWPEFLGLIIIGGIFFGVSLYRFRSTISQMA